MKKILKNIPVTLKVTLWYTVFVVILISVMLGFSLSIADNNNQKELIESVREIAEDTEEFEDFDDGIYFIRYNDNGIEAEGISPKGFPLDLGFSGDSVRLYRNKGVEYYYYDMKINRPDGGWIRGIASASTFSGQMDSLLMIMIILSPLSLIMIVYGGYRIIKEGMKPVGKISQTASEIQKSGDFSKRIEIDEGNDEIHKMADTFNEMLDSLESSYLREKRFNSDVSHELRTPVSVILSESQYVLGYSETIEEARESMEVIQRQSRRMSELINQIMELSRIEKIVNESFEEISFSELIDKAAADYRSLLLEKNILTDVKIEEKLFVNGDKVMLERVFDNLLNNAMKFTEDRISIRLYREDEECVLKVKDNGMGIPEKERKLIWDRFYQVNNSRNKEINKGFGLGLSMAAKIVEYHKGTIDVESGLGKGAEFIVRMKLANRGR